jgi:phosphatidylglycerophosphate synthase
VGTKLLPVSDPFARRHAISALCRSVYKPTDNAFARANRRISVPLSRLLLCTSISPNAISVLGAAIALAAALCYAQGGYWPMLAGAFLSWFSSMWDGCDGEVARLSFRETPLGCWLESVCDDLYYIGVLLGITVGLYREGNPRLVLGLGTLALTGAITTYALHYVLRAKVARTNGPAAFARIFEERMLELGRDPIARFARASYKIGTRSTLPYLLLVFALFGQTRLMLYIVAVGAHLYWVITLYIWYSAPLGTRVETRAPP